MSARPQAGTLEGYETAAQQVLAAVRAWKADHPAATAALPSGRPPSLRWKVMDPTKVVVCAVLDRKSVAAYADSDDARALLAFVCAREPDATWMMFVAAMSIAFGDRWWRVVQ